MIPRITREQADAVIRHGQVTNSGRYRQVAHVLTVLGFDEDGPLYHLECRADARDQDKSCAHFLDHYGDTDVITKFYPGCALKQDEELDEAVRALKPKRGIYLVSHAPLTEGEPPSLRAEAVLREFSADLNVASFVSVEPTRVARYPGFGPEADLRELIEAALREDESSAAWDDDTWVLLIDASRVAEAVWRWAQEHYAVERARWQDRQRQAIQQALTAGATPINVVGELL